MNPRSCLAMGLVLVVMGFQLRTVDTFILNQKTSDFIEKKIKSSAIVSPSPYEATAYALPGLSPRKQLTHPRWVGLAFISCGVVLVLHGLSRRGA